MVATTVQRAKNSLTILLVLAAGLVSAAQARAERPSPLLITDVTVVSPERGEPLESAWVAVDGATILRVGEGPIPEDLAGYTRIDGHGHFLTPGLIDGHVHLQSIPGMSWNLQQAYPELVRAYVAQLPKSFLYYGFTGVVDLAPQDAGSLDRLRRSPLHPDLFACGPPIPLANGYPMVFVPPAARFFAFANFLYDPRQSEVIPESIDAAGHSPSAVVARATEGESVCVKTFVEDGFGPAKIWPVPTASMLRGMAEAASEAGRPLLVHANAFDAWNLALEGGADLLVHGLWTWDAHQATDPGTGLPGPVRALVDRAVRDGVAVMPTLQVIAGDGALFDPEFLDHPALPNVLPEALIAWYRGPEGRWFADDLLGQMPPEQATPEAMWALHRKAMSRNVRVTEALAEAGGRIIFGSDTPSGPSYGNPPGLNGYLELRRLAEAGLPLPRLLAAATVEVARIYGLDDQYGTVEAGKVANLLLLTKNPLDTVDAYDAIDLVILRGEAIARPRLSATTSRPSP